MRGRADARAAGTGREPAGGRRHDHAGGSAGGGVRRAAARSTRPAQRRRDVLARARGTGTAPLGPTRHCPVAEESVARLPQRAGTRDRERGRSPAFPPSSTRVRSRDDRVVVVLRLLAHLAQGRSRRAARCPSICARTFGDAPQRRSLVVRRVVLDERLNWEERLCAGGRNVSAWRPAAPPSVRSGAVGLVTARGPLGGHPGGGAHRAHATARLSETRPAPPSCRRRATYRCRSGAAGG